MGLLEKIKQDFKDNEKRQNILMLIVIMIGLFSLGVFIGILWTQSIYSDGYLSCIEFVKHKCLNPNDFVIP